MCDWYEEMERAEQERDAYEYELSLEYERGKSDGYNEGIADGRESVIEEKLFDRAIVLKAFEWQSRMDVIDCDGCAFPSECMNRNMNCWEIMTEKFFEQMKEKNMEYRAEEECKTLGEAYDEGYDKGRADVINAIKNDLHKRLTEEMNNPYQDQGLCQGLYFGIQRCDWYLDTTKENGDG